MEATPRARSTSKRDDPLPCSCRGRGIVGPLEGGPEHMPSCQWQPLLIPRRTPSWQARTARRSGWIRPKIAASRLQIYAQAHGHLNRAAKAA